MAETLELIRYLKPRQKNRFDGVYNINSMNDQGKKNLTKNTAYYIAALILQKIISFAYFSFIATRLGSENIGKYFFALSFTAIFSIFIDVGLINILIRNTARDPSEAQKLLSLNLAIKLPLAFFIYLVVISLGFLLGYSGQLRLMIAITGIIMMVDSFTLTFYGVFRGFHNLRFESLGTVIFQIIVATSGLIIIYFTREPIILLLAILLASLFNFFYSLFLVRLKLHLKIKLLFKKDEIFNLLKTTIPFALAGIFTKIYAYIDTVFLSLFSTSKAIGLYSLPYKMTFALQFIPLAFMASLYPLFSSYFNKDHLQLAKFYEKSLYYLLIIVLPIVFGIIILGDQIILKIYGLEYQPSILSLQILMLGLIFVFLNFPASYLLNACHQQKKLTQNIGLIMIFNIILNLILIKYLNLSFIGASFASSLSSIILFLMNFYLTLKIIKFNLVNFLIKLGKLTICLLVMVGVIIFIKNQLPLIFNIIIAGLSYTIFIFLTKSVTKADLKILFQSIFNKTYEENPPDHS